MTIKILIAHSKGEEVQAERLAEPIRAAGYEVAHAGTVMVGDSLVAEASKLLAEGSPVVLCGTVRAIGTGWAPRLVNAARNRPGVRVFIVQMEEEADTASLDFGEKVALYWQDPAKAETDLIAALHKWYPPDQDTRDALRGHDLEARYRALALKACDIVDLANLPEDDRHLATRELELRRLYVALRMRLEVRAGVATAYLLRLQQAPDFADLPDVATLPAADWLPILIRCRDLPPEADTLDAMLLHSLRRGELPLEHCEPLRHLLRERLERGEALLLIDGLDEITDPGARARFAAHLETIHRANEQAPMVVTSRIVGYREMGYRIRSGFEHLTVADLTDEDKADFARRWCALTERPERRDAAAEELIRDIHASDRIRRLTGNPMLLTTMALIKRKIGRLPQRRVDLYEKAVEVLLNWRSQVDTPLDPREALPQLEYLAHAMCADGVQQLREDQALDLLRRVRADFPQLHALAQHSPEDFLDLLERRTGLLIQSGHTRHQGRGVPVYEFRHLTFQEYLAGIALVQGHYPDRDRSQTLAEAIAPLAGAVGHSDYPRWGSADFAVVENWREALRLCLAACGDDEVDAALLAILHTLPGEIDTARPRAVMAALCLADEPNVSDDVAEEVLRAFVAAVGEGDGGGIATSSLDAAAMELAQSRWSAALAEHLLDAFFGREAQQRHSPGGLYARVRDSDAPEEDPARSEWLMDMVPRLTDGEERDAAAVALTVMDSAFKKQDCWVPGMAEGLTRRLSGSAPMSHAAAWALGWMTDRRHADRAWRPDAAQLDRLLAAAASPDCDSEALFWLAKILGDIEADRAVTPLLAHLPNSPPRTQAAILVALGAIGDPLGLAALPDYLDHDDESVRRAALGGLAETCNDGIDRKLLSAWLTWEPWGLGLDPRSPITADRIAKAARQLERPPQEIRERYERLAMQFDLRLEW
ncbi:NACHT domain-containing protein [Thiococcus pfennigii]|uniref:NACHT domain-containing protein n=1 Tax=Thiococcus pfennigii TaxID=1057 RepID=UPI00190614D8|nr:HEAT repeat domain-containing protein [Thiococcus pfennigii]MBK1700137.1 hypothetical protein [Thiococcus pfennigii]